MRRGVVTILIVVVAAVVLAGPGAAVATAQTFGDVSGGDWFYTAVEQLSAAGVVNGFGDGTFRPYEPVTRAQFAAMLARAVAPPQMYQEPFEDVSPADWFYGSVASLYQAGLIAGTSPTTFSPSQSIDRQQTATLAMRAVAYAQARAAEEQTGEPPASAAASEAAHAVGTVAGGAPSSEETGTLDAGTPASGGVADGAALAALPALSTVDLELTPDEMEAWLAGFKDRGFIASAHRLSVANAYRYAVVSGSADGWFYPTFGLTRAQAAGILYQALYSALQERPAPPTPVPAAESYPELRQGSTGFLVSFIESRLSALKYDVGRLDGVYDEPLRDAVRAFQKVEGLSRDGTVGPQVWSRIGKARTPTPRYSTGGNRVEIDLSRQVLFLIRDGRVAKILPVATGAPGWTTPSGTYRIFRKLPYWRESALGLLYKPSYFVGGIAIHGSYSIPPYPASHGCVRIPVWATDAIYPQLPIGMQVSLYY